MRNIRRVTYLDALAGSKVRKRIVNHMNIFYKFGNPVEHTYQGRYLQDMLSRVKHNVSCIYELPQETIDSYDIRFCQSTTDALITWYDMICDCYPIPHIVVSPCNSSVELDILHELVLEGRCSMTVLSVDYKGKISMNELYSIIHTAALVSVNATNNMTGLREDIRAISNACRDHGSIFFSDTANHGIFNASDILIDAFVSTSYKINGPSGSCFLMYRRFPYENYNMRLQGTLNIALIEGHAEALRWHNKHSHRLNRLYNRLRCRLRSKLRQLLIPIVQYTGQQITFNECIVLYSNNTDEYDPRVTLMSIFCRHDDLVGMLNESYNINVGIGDVETRVLTSITDGICALSTNYLRLSFQYCTTEKDIDKFVKAIRSLLMVDPDVLDDVTV